MISTDGASHWLLRLVAPLVWRNDVAVARKLHGFAATEAGSALDMLKAAELTADPKLRRLFFRHATDEARHAQLFRDAARRLDPAARASDYQLISATRQNLFAELGLVRFVAFVHLAERRGELQFRALRDHFAGSELAPLFARIAGEERFHVAYSGKLLARWRAEGRGGEVRVALARVRLARATGAWMRSGRVLGDLISRVLLSLIYLVVLPLFVLIQRRSEPTRAGWKMPRRVPRPRDAARRQF